MFILNHLDEAGEDTPVLFNDEIYFFDVSGDFLTCRAAGVVVPKNLHSILEDDEQQLLRDNIFFYGLRPLLLLDSSLGPIFVDCSLCPFYGLLVAIVPHFSIAEILALANGELSDLIQMSPAIKKLMENRPEVELYEEHRAFESRLLATHRGGPYYRTHGKTNAELAIMLSEIAHDIACLYGCELEIITEELREYDLESDPSPEAFRFAISELCMLARRYSSNRSARLYIVFGEKVIYFEFGFMLATEYRNIKLIEKARELKHFTKRADMCLFDYYYKQDEKVFALRGFPVRRRPDSSSLKASRTEFIYDD